MLAPLRVVSSTPNQLVPSQNARLGVLTLPTARNGPMMTTLDASATTSVGGALGPDCGPPSPCIGCQVLVPFTLTLWHMYRHGVPSTDENGPTRRRVVRHTAAYAASTSTTVVIAVPSHRLTDDTGAPRPSAAGPSKEYGERE